MVSITDPGLEKFMFKVHSVIELVRFSFTLLVKRT